MAFPQTRPSGQVIAGKPFWRLFTPLESSGDIYEADVSALAFVLGPESDLDAVELTYYDEDAPGKATSVTISKDKPMIGRLDAFVSRKYGTGQNGRILISPQNIIPQPAYEPIGFVAGDSVVIESSFIDVLQYFSKAPDIIPPRNDRTFLYQALPVISSQSVWFYLPYYGRRHAVFTTKDINGAGNYTFTIAGVTLNNGGGVGGLSPVNTELNISGPTAIAAGADAQVVITDADGMHDGLLIEIDYTALTEIFMKIVVSDQGA